MTQNYYEGVSIYFCLLVIISFIYCESENVTNLTRLGRQIDNGTTCELFIHPKNGRWSVLMGEGRPGDKVPKDTVLKYECHPGYKLSTRSPFLVCDENWAYSKIPTCEKKCAPKYSSSTTKLKCEDKYGKDVPCDQAVDGTFLSYSCIPFYEVPLGYKKTILCVEGTWNFPNPICQPVCGKKIDNDALTLIINGTIKEKREYPWIIAIFHKPENDQFRNICGGSLISQKIVVTAAHCVANDYGNALPADQFRLGAGKYYSKYQDARDEQAQYVEVARIVVKSEYKGSAQRFAADIALLITKDLVVFNEVVQPVCYQDLSSIHLQAGKVGVIAGWGTTETGVPSDELRTLEIPFKHESVCSGELPVDWANKYYTGDKLCAGFLNESKSACTGDSGSGLYFKNAEDNRYYIHGIVSIAPTIDGGCNPQQNSLFTKVSSYYEFLDRETTRQYVEHCSLPEYPDNGKWIVTGQTKKPGDIVPSTTILKVECNQGYKLSTATNFIECKSSHALPKCDLVCPKLSFPEGTTFKCTNRQEDELDCAKAVHGTRLTYSCPEGFEAAHLNNKIKFCKTGSWGRRKPECIPKTETIKIDQAKVVCTYDSSSAHQGVFPEAFNASLCTHLVYAYIGLWKKGDVRVQEDPLELDEGNKTGLYRRVTDMKKRNKDLKVLLSIGGTAAANSSLFSEMASDGSKKPGFIYSAIYFIETYNFDGVDIAWDYPEPSDKANYINLLKDFREQCDKRGWLMTATVRYNPDDTGYYGPEMAQLLDWIHVKTYDFYGPWSSYTGHISPLYPASVETDWEKDHLNIQAAGNNWVKFGIPKSKIVLSVAFHGRVLTLEDKNKNGIHAPLKETGSTNSSVVKYSEICALRTKNWMFNVWDNDQKSVYSYLEDQWISHESKDTAWIKGAYIKENGFLGVNVWPLDGDDVFGKCGSKQILLKHVHGGMGLKPNFNN